MEAFLVRQAIHGLDSLVKATRDIKEASVASLEYALGDAMITLADNDRRDSGAVMWGQSSWPRPYVACLVVEQAWRIIRNDDSLVFTAMLGFPHNEGPMCSDAQVRAALREMEGMILGFGPYPHGIVGVFAHWIRTGEVWAEDPTSDNASTTSDSTDTNSNATDIDSDATESIVPDDAIATLPLPKIDLRYAYARWSCAYQDVCRKLHRGNFVTLWTTTRNFLALTGRSSKFPMARMLGARRETLPLAELGHVTLETREFEWAPEMPVEVVAKRLGFTVGDMESLLEEMTGDRMVRWAEIFQWLCLGRHSQESIIYGES